MDEHNSPHDSSNAINLDWLDIDFVNALPHAWSRETCWPGCIETYPENSADNPSYGNCLVTVLMAWGHHGYHDEIVPGLVHLPEGGDPVWHFRLAYTDPDEGRIEIDPTWQQFKPGAVFEPVMPGHPQYEGIIEGSFFQDPSLEMRMEHFAGVLEKHYIQVNEFTRPSTILRALKNKYQGGGAPQPSPML